jgi:hypothetical protein
MSDEQKAPEINVVSGSGNTVATCSACGAVASADYTPDDAPLDDPRVDKAEMAAVQDLASRCPHVELARSMAPEIAAKRAKMGLPPETLPRWLTANPRAPQCSCGKYTCAPRTAHVHAGGVHSIVECLADTGLLGWNIGDEVTLGGELYVVERPGVFRLREPKAERPRTRG